MQLPVHYRQQLERLPYLAVPAPQFELLSSAKDFKTRILTLIEAATTRIYLVALYLQDDEAGREILAALYAAKARNPALDVKVFVDFHRAQRGLIGKNGQGGNHLCYQRFAQEHPDVKIEIYGVPVKSKELLGVLHLKGFIFDETLLYSGASLNNVYLHQLERYRYDRYHQITNGDLSDTFVRYIDRVLLTQKAVQRLDVSDIPSAKQLKREIRELKVALMKSRYDFTATSNGRYALGVDQVQVTPLVGLGKRNNLLNQTTRQLLRATEREIFICTPYFNPPAMVARDIATLLKLGRTVTIVVGDKHANDFFIPEGEPFSTIGALPYLYEGNLRAFARANQHYIDKGRLNICLWRDGDNTFHLKGVTVDEEWLLLTGSNLNPRAWGLDLENGLLVHDPLHLLTEKFAAERNDILANTRRLSHFSELEEPKSYPEPVRKLLTRIHRLKAHLLIKKII